MPDSDRISFNALRIFDRVADLGSVSGAAQDLGVTPSAVSHQMRRLEQALGCALFHRRGNSLGLTPQGARLRDQAAPGLRLLEQATGALLRDGNELVLRCGVTFAVRWLVPALERFKARHKGLRIRLETTANNSADPVTQADIDITYDRGADDTQTLMPDLCCPVLRPDLLQRHAGRVTQIPALMATADNWDWHAWATASGIAPDMLTLTDRFDIDDSALRAAAAGLGMTLTSRLLVAQELDQGALVPLPGVAPVRLGRYVLRMGPRDTGPMRKFQSWLRAELTAQPSFDGSD